MVIWGPLGHYIIEALGAVLYNNEDAETGRTFLVSRNALIGALEIVSRGGVSGEPVTLSTTHPLFSS
jgi:hypothetical protein